MNKQWDTVWYHANIAVCAGNLGTITDGAIAVKDGKIAWTGSMSALPAAPEELASQSVDVSHRLITPGLIDCHTHVIYAGNRANEFSLRLQGMSYAAIAQQGGGIQATVNATRCASVQELYLQSLKRVLVMLQNGVTTLEIKSGYGLDWETEYKMLRVAQMLQATLPLSICKTFLGAHKVPPEYQNAADDYVTQVCDEMLPKVATEHLAEAVDVFCETIAFDLAQTERVFAKAQQLGLAIKCHAEQLSASGAAKLAARYQALSVDHLEHLTPRDVTALAEAGTVAVLLPGAFYYLAETQKPPITALREQGVPIAIATDCNPGTSPVLSLLTIMNMACVMFGLTPEESLLGATCFAAKALGLTDRGSLSVGKNADLAIWDVSHPEELVYYVGNTPLYKLIKDGKDLSKI